MTSPPQVVPAFVPYLIDIEIFRQESGGIVPLFKLKVRF